MQDTNTFTERLEAFKNLLATHDWYYHYSDDHRVYCAGQSHSNKISNMLRDFKQNQEEYDQAYALYERCAERYFPN